MDFLQALAVTVCFGASNDGEHTKTRGLVGGYDPAESHCCRTGTRLRYSSPELTSHMTISACSLLFATPAARGYQRIET